MLTFFVFTPSELICDPSLPCQGQKNCTQLTSISNLMESLSLHLFNVHHPYPVVIFHEVGSDCTENWNPTRACGTLPAST